MKLTKTAQELEDLDGDYNDLTPEQDALSSCMGSEDFGYALFDGGYLNPKDWVEGEDLIKLEEAIKLVGEFKELVESLHQEF